MATYKCKPQNSFPKTFISNLSTTQHFELLISLLLSGISTDKLNVIILFCSLYADNSDTHDG